MLLNLFAIRLMCADSHLPPRSRYLANMLNIFCKIMTLLTKNCVRVPLFSLFMRNVVPNFALFLFSSLFFCLLKSCCCCSPSSVLFAPLMYSLKLIEWRLTRHIKLGVWNRAGDTIASVNCFQYFVFIIMVGGLKKKNKNKIERYCWSKKVTFRHFLTYWFSFFCLFLF